MGSFTYLDETPKTSSFTYLDEEKKKKSKKEAMFFAAQLGFFDTVRGVQQIAGYDADKLAEDQQELHELEKEYGGGVTAAYYGGLVADPVGWFLPVSRLKYIKHGAGLAQKVKNLVLPGAASGAIAGGLGYVDEETGFTRPQQAALGAAGGAALGPLAAGVAKVGGKMYEPGGEAIDRGLTTRLDASGATVGGLAGYNVHPDAPIEDKMVNALIGATIGGGVGMGASKAMSQSQKDSVGRFFIPDYGLADNFIARRSKFYGDRKAIGGEFDELVKRVAGLPVNARKALYKMLTDKNAKMDEALEPLKGEARTLVKKYGEELRDMGLIDRNTFQNNVDTYMHRTYTRHEKDKFLDTSDKIQTIGDELKLRGLKRHITQENYVMMKYPDKKGRWQKMGMTDDGKVIVRRDWTPEERTRMGEITDAAYSLDRTGKLLANDVAAFRFFKDLADDPTIASADQVGRFTREITGSDFGPAMKGKYVSEEVYRDLMGVRKLNFLAKYKKNPVAKVYRKLNSMWKGTKTILNPAVHMNNILSNVHMYDFADGSIADVARAARDMFSKTAEFKEAQDLGVFGGFFADELGDAGKILNIYSTAGKGVTDDATSFLGAAGRIAEKTFRLAKKGTWDAAARLYTLEDQIFRMALYRSKKADLLRQGLEETTAATQAAKTAREWFVDYERTAPFLELMREGPLPFISYMYGIIPRLAETAAKKPAKIAKWGLVWHGVNKAGEDMSDKTPEQIDRQRRMMSEERQRGVFGIPGMPSTMIKMPDMISPKGRDDWYLDIGRMIPGGDVYSKSEGRLGQIPWLPQGLQPGFGAAGAIAAPLMGVDQFQGREIPEGKKLEAMAKNFAPNWPIPGFPSWSGRKLTRAQSGKYSQTKDVHTPESAYLSGFGLKTTPVSTRKLKKRAGYPVARKIREKESEKRSIQSERKAGGYTATEAAKLISQINREILELKREKRRAEAGRPKKSWVREMAKQYEDIF